MSDSASTTAWKPTQAEAGSEVKVAVMEERARLGLPLFHPGDNPRRVQGMDIVSHKVKNKPRSTRPGRYICRTRNGKYRGWVVRVMRQGFVHHVGHYKTFEAAVEARDAFLRERGELDAEDGGMSHAG